MTGSLRNGGEDEEESDPSASTIDGPWRVSGQRVDFCVSPDTKHPIHHLRYVARVVSPGTYRWESPVIQSSIVPDHGKALPSGEVVIAK